MSKPTVYSLVLFLTSMVLPNSLGGATITKNEKVNIMNPKGSENALRSLIPI